VNAELKQADAGLVCLTAQSLHSEWVLFEAGALSTAVALNTGESRVFTYLLGVEPRALQGPLSVYQSTVATMEDTLRLTNSLLGYLDRGQMGARDFAAAWNTLWPRVQQLEDEPVTSIVPDLARLFGRKTFVEPVQECADQSWFQRYDGAVATRNELKAQKDLVAAECDAPLAELYRDLVADGLRNQLAESLPQLLTSDWELDRIAAYLYGERRADGQDTRDALAAARRELDLTRAADQPRLMPLHYSLRWARATGPYSDPRLAVGVRTLADAARDTIASKDLDPGGQVRELLRDLRALAAAG
jgi:hypothetical protein